MKLAAKLLGCLQRGSRYDTVDLLRIAHGLFNVQRMPWSTRHGDVLRLEFAKKCVWFGRNRLPTTWTNPEEKIVIFKRLVSFSHHFCFKKWKTDVFD